MSRALAPNLLQSGPPRSTKAMFLYVTHEPQRELNSGNSLLFHKKTPRKVQGVLKLKFASKTKRADN